MKRKIVFHKLRKTFNEAAGFKLEPADSHQGRLAVLEDFEATEGATLNAICGMVTGWRTRLYSDEVDIEFVGDGWREEEMAQGRGRARPVFLRKDPP